MEMSTSGARGGTGSSVRELRGKFVLPGKSLLVHSRTDGHLCGKNRCGEIVERSGGLEW